MKLNPLVYLVLTLSIACLSGCASISVPPASSTPTPSQPAKQEATNRIAGPLPESGFKAQVDLVEPPPKLRAGEKVIVNVRVKNASDVMWYARGGEINTNPSNKFFLAVGNRWLQPDGKVLTNMDGRYGFDRDLKPGEETTLPLQITAPRTPGEYLLDVDVVQEQVAWFNEKGSPTAQAKVTVVR